MPKILVRKSYGFGEKQMMEVWLLWSNWCGWADFGYIL
jgi:hypothetical protein